MSFIFTLWNRRFALSCAREKLCWHLINEKMPYITCLIILIDIHNVLVLDTKCRSQHNSFIIQLFILSMSSLKQLHFWFQNKYGKRLQLYQHQIVLTMYSYTKRYHKNVWKQTNKTWHIFLFLSYINSTSTLDPTTDTNHS